MFDKLGIYRIFEDVEYGRQPAARGLEVRDL